MIDRRLSVAPMLDWTDKYCRFFLRQISRHTLLYTEMITTGALLHGNKERLLGYFPEEHPVALQLGGSDPGDLAKCSRLGEVWGYDEINLNLGCPSDRVQAGRFGACLMKEPSLVADCVKSMCDSVSVPVTVKQRIGVDDLDDYQQLCDFVGLLAEAGSEVFVVHARKAWLQGLSPKENREIPPLRYDIVYRLKRDFPRLTIVINGGIDTLGQARQQLKQVDGVMIGRAAYHNPWLLAEADRSVFGRETRSLDRSAVLEAMTPMIERELTAGVPLNRISRHMLGLYHGRPGARAWRRHLSENAWRKNAGNEVLLTAASKLPPTAV